MKRKPKRFNEDDPYEDVDLSFDIGKGDCIQLTDNPYRPIKSRPIGFTANIDIEEPYNSYGKVFKSSKSTSRS